MIDQSTKKVILLGIVSSIIVMVFVDPLLKLAWQIIIWLGDVLSSNISSHFIKQIAIGQTNSTPLLFGTIIAFVPAFFIIPFITPFFASILLKRTQNNTEALQSKMKKLLVVLIIMWFIPCLLGGVSVLLNYVYNARFNQYIAIVKPHVDDTNITILKSQWASMEKIEDLMEIEQTLDTMFSGTNHKRLKWWD